MNTMTVFQILIIALLLVILGPFITIWSLNTLFKLGIPYDFYTWLAMVWLNTMVFGRWVRQGNR